jgi:hypothetical protein
MSATGKIQNVLFASGKSFAKITEQALSLQEEPVVSTL